jgi:hypothetical protein
MPPVLDPSKSKVDGLAFLGLSLTRHSSVGNQDSITHQTAFDLNKVLDRDYKHIRSTNDDVWLVGGGEPGPPDSYKLAAKDSAHVEIMRIGTYKPEWGGLAVEKIVQALEGGAIYIPEIKVLPTAVVANPDKPPELEIRFDMQVPDIVQADILDPRTPLPVNWQLRFLHNQLFRHFKFPSRFCPGPFHSTIVRKAEFRSPADRVAYFTKCEQVVKEWKAAGGPQSLVVPTADEASSMKNIIQVKCSKQSLLSNTISNEAMVHKAMSMDVDNDVKTSSSFGKANDDHKGKGAKIVPDDAGEPTYSASCQSGLWLFTDRNTITHQFVPNFLPPYNTRQKREIIWSFLRDEWDEKTLSWVPVDPNATAVVPDAGKKETDLSVGSMLTEMMDYVGKSCAP